MEQKTKEIVERLRGNGRRPEDSAMIVSTTKDQTCWPTKIDVEAASLIESLSERVGELERLWGERCMTGIESQSALSKQGERS